MVRTSPALLAASQVRWRITVLDVTSMLTLLVSIYLTFAARNYFQFAVLIKLALLAGVWPSFRRSCYLWFSVVALWLPTMVLEWCKHEDHVYLAFYWYAVLALATLPPARKAGAGDLQNPLDPEKYLRTSARVLVGLCFLFATGWKVGSTEFRDGSLFHYKLTCDDRFSETLARFPGGMETSAILANYASLETMRAPGSASDGFSMQWNSRVSWLAYAMTWWTVAIEGLLAAAFLWPRRRGVLYRFRNPLLIVFALTTYSIAPVMGYGFTLMILGYANCEREDRRGRASFVAALVALLLILVFRDSLVPATIRDR
jgi:hypothetical protein